MARRPDNLDGFNRVFIIDWASGIGAFGVGGKRCH